MSAQDLCLVAIAVCVLGLLRAAFLAMRNDYRQFKVRVNAARSEQERGENEARWRRKDVERQLLEPTDDPKRYTYLGSGEFVFIEGAPYWCSSESLAKAAERRQRAEDIIDASWWSNR